MCVACPASCTCFHGTSAHTHVNTQTTLTYMGCTAHTHLHSYTSLHTHANIQTCRNDTPVHMHAWTHMCINTHYAHKYTNTCTHMHTHIVCLHRHAHTSTWLPHSAFISSISCLHTLVLTGTLEYPSLAPCSLLPPRSLFWLQAPREGVVEVWPEVWTGHREPWL